MNKDWTNEQAERLLKAIFAKDDDTEPAEAEAWMPEMPDNFPDTVLEKVGYAEYVLTNGLQYIGKALYRLSRLQGLLRVTEKDSENCLPNIITNNELRMALEPLLRVHDGVKEITEMLLQIYHDTKPKEAQHE
jgi:hypothetical protein